jgi:hypothetical protein
MVRCHFDSLEEQYASTFGDRLPDVLLVYSMILLQKTWQSADHVNECHHQLLLAGLYTILTIAENCFHYYCSPTVSLLATLFSFAFTFLRGTIYLWWRRSPFVLTVCLRHSHTLENSPANTDAMTHFHTIRKRHVRICLIMAILDLREA